MRAAILAAAVLFYAQAQGIAADPAAGWRGVKVLPKSNAVVKVENVIIEVQAHPTLPLPWIVQDVDGEWLWVGGHRKGWVRRSQVVTLDEAPAYYTQLINSDSDNA
jgi:hypothetical protein